MYKLVKMRLSENKTVPAETFGETPSAVFINPLYNPWLTANFRHNPTKGVCNIWEEIAPKLILNSNACFLLFYV